MPRLREGEGHSILISTSPHKTVELSYRAFWITWELIEAAARKNYEKYKVGPLPHIAEAHLEAVCEFRSAFHGRPVKPLSPERATELRTKSEKGPKTGSLPKATKESQNGAQTTKKRCRECWDADIRFRCIGPLNHRGRHRDKTGRRWVDT